MNEIKMQKKDNTNLLKAEAAVEDFLDALLQESTETIETAKPVRLKPNISLIPELGLDVVTAEVKVEEKIVEIPLPEVLAVDQEIQQTITSDNEPDYQFPLQCLMFSVADNELSIPLIKLGGVIPWGGRLTLLPDSPEWFLGLMKYRDGNIKVADTASVIEIYETKARQSDSRHILVFGEDSWAITCDKLGDVIKLNKDDIQWTKQEGKGLALGTIKDSLAILLDPAKILAKLK